MHIIRDCLSLCVFSPIVSLSSFMAGACGRSNRSQSKAMIFSLGVSSLNISAELTSLRVRHVE